MLNDITFIRISKNCVLSLPPLITHSLFFFIYLFIIQCVFHMSSVSSQCFRVCLSHLSLLCSLQHLGGVRAPLQLLAPKCVLHLPSLLPQCPAPGHSHSGVARQSVHHPRSETRHGKCGDVRPLIDCVIPPLFSTCILLKNK